jgi:transcriptional regulator with XRE-family HTH domain
MTTSTAVTAGATRRRAPKLEFGDYVRAARRSLGLNQESFAAQLGVKTTTLGAWETGRNTPDNLAEVAEMLERATGISRAWFLGWGDAPAPRPEGAINSGWRSRKVVIAGPARPAPRLLSVAA